MTYAWTKIDFDDRHQPAAEEVTQLPFEKEFDGHRRDRTTGVEPHDPSRYWEIFSGTD